MPNYTFGNASFAYEPLNKDGVIVLCDVDDTITKGNQTRKLQRAATELAGESSWQAAEKFQLHLAKDRSEWSNEEKDHEETIKQNACEQRKTQFNNSVEEQWKIIEKDKEEKHFNGTLEKIKKTIELSQQSGIFFTLSFSDYPGAQQKMLAETLGIQANFLICDINKLLESESKEHQEPTYTFIKNNHLTSNLVVMINGNPEEGNATKATRGYHIDWAKKILAKLGHTPCKTIFVDDDEENCEAAKNREDLKDFHVIEAKEDGKHWDQIQVQLKNKTNSHTPINVSQNNSTSSQPTAAPMDIDSKKNNSEISSKNTTINHKRKETEEELRAKKKARTDTLLIAKDSPITNKNQHQSSSNTLNAQNSLTQNFADKRFIFKQ